MQGVRAPEVSRRSLRLQMSAFLLTLSRSLSRLASFSCRDRPWMQASCDSFDPVSFKAEEHRLGNTSLGRRTTVTENSPEYGQSRFQGS